MTRISQIAAYLTLALIATSAGLYAISSPYLALTRVTAAAGAAGLVASAALNYKSLWIFFGRRSSRYGANMVLTIILFTSVVVIVQALSIRHSLRFDLTRNKRFSLAPQTLNILRNIEGQIAAYCFFKASSSDRLQAEGLLDQYAHHAPGTFRYEFIDPDRHPNRAEEMQIKNYGTTVLEYRGKREYVNELTEEKLTNAILKISRDVRKVVCFLQGHGEKEPEEEGPSGYSIVKDAIEKQNYAARTFSLFEEGGVPEDCSVLVVAGPRNDFIAGENDLLVEYLARGGNAAFLVDPVGPLPRLEEILGRYRVLLEQDVVIDPYSRLFGGGYTVPVVTQYVDHPITESLTAASFFPMARSVNMSADNLSRVRAQYLARASKSAWGETDLEGVRRGEAARGDGDVSPPIALGMISTRTFTTLDSAKNEFESKLVVFGDSDFADNSSFRLSSNGDLFLNIVNYLAEEKDLVSIRAKHGLGDRMFLTARQLRLIFLTCVILLPLGVIGFGTTVFTRRRRSG